MEIKILDDNFKSRPVRVYEGVAPTITSIIAGRLKVVNEELNIRKLTPRECWRLMDVEDKYFDKAQKVNSNTQLYKQAGNAIVVSVLEAILKNLVGDMGS